MPKTPVILKLLRRGRTLRAPDGGERAPTVRAPVIVTGRIVTPQKAEAALAAGVCDLVGMTRAILADPHMPNKAAEGRPQDIRQCVGISEGCIGLLRQGKAITCVQNPVAGREAELAEIKETESPRWVVVVGGGVRGA